MMAASAASQITPDITLATRVQAPYTRAVGRCLRPRCGIARSASRQTGVATASTNSSPPKSNMAEAKWTVRAPTIIASIMEGVLG